jgi:hypothetical protein
MTDQLFRKAVWLTDLHFGRAGNSPVANQDNLDFLDWAIDRALAWGAETAIFGGDWHDQRHTLHVATLDASLAGMDKLAAGFDCIHWLPGNHDLLYRERRDVASIAFARHIAPIHLIHAPFVQGDVTLLPWLVGDEARHLNGLDTRYVFGHLELAGFHTNASAVMADAPHLLKADQFATQDQVFSGHFHRRQSAGRIIYTGSAMPHDFNDVDDAERGIMLLAWGRQPVFEAWPDQPLYRSTTLSALLADPAAILRPKLTLRARVDVTLPADDIHALRAVLETECGIRRLEWLHAAPADVGAQVFQDARVAFRTVDQMVIDGIHSVKSNEIDPNRLVALYQDLVDETHVTG